MASPTPINRRQMLGTISGSLIAGSTFSTVSGFEGITERIPMTIHNGEVLEWKEVPREWNRHRKRSRLAVEKVKRKHAANEWVQSITRTSTDESIGQLQKFELIIRTENQEKANNEIPDQYHGIPIRFDQPKKFDADTGQDSSSTQSSCWWEGDDCVPGGSHIKPEKEDTTTNCTSTSLVEIDGDPYMMSAAHCFTDINCRFEPYPNIFGHEMSLHTEDRIGDVEYYSMYQDWAVAPLANDAEVDGLDNSIEDESRQVIGSTSQSGVDALVASSETVYKRGIATCIQSGEVEAVDSWNYCDTFPYSDFVILSAERAVGDSGGPYYRYFTFNNQPYISILGLHYGRADARTVTNYPDDWAGGTAAYEIVDSMSDVGLSFGSLNNYCS